MSYTQLITVLVRSPTATSTATYATATAARMLTGNYDAGVHSSFIRFASCSLRFANVGSDSENDDANSDSDSDCGGKVPLPKFD